MESFFMEALVWALRHSIVIQLHTFYVTTFDDVREVAASGKAASDVEEFLRYVPLHATVQNGLAHPALALGSRLC